MLRKFPKYPNQLAVSTTDAWNARTQGENTTFIIATNKFNIQIINFFIVTQVIAKLSKFLCYFISFEMKTKLNYVQFD